MCDAGDDQRVDQAQQDAGDDGVENGVDDVLLHGVSLRQPNGGDEHVNELDADEWDDDAAESIDEEVALQQGSRGHRPVLHAAQSERDQRDDDQRVEDDRGEDGGLRRLAGA